MAGLGSQTSGCAGGYAGYGVFFFGEKQLAALRHLFPCQKNTPHPPTVGQHGYRQFFNREPANARRRGVAVGFFAGKRCLSAASCFSKKNPTATPQARPHNRKSGSPSQAHPHNRKPGRPSFTLT